MKADRAPVLNRFEKELATAIDARANQADHRRRARLAVLGTLVVLGTVAGVAYAWTRPIDDDHGLATNGPDGTEAPATVDTTAPTTGSAPVANAVLLASGHVTAGDWRLEIGDDIRSAYGEPSKCVALRLLPPATESTYTCETFATLTRYLDDVAVYPLRMDDVGVWGGWARSDVVRVELRDAADAVIANTQPVASEAMPGGAWWAVVDVPPSTVHRLVPIAADGSELPGFVYPASVGDRAPERAAIEKAARGGITAIGTEDPDQFIDDPTGIEEMRDGLAAAYPEQAGHTTLVMHEITFSGSDTAQFTYDVLLAPPLDSQSLYGLVGQAVRIDGTWKVTRATACQVFNWGKGTC